MALNKKSILFVTTQYRTGERVYPIIPFLAEDYNVDLYKTYHMHPQTGKWGGDKDLRKVFDIQYNKFFKEIFSEINNINFSKYNLIITDDCRVQSGMREIYAKRHCLMVSNCHGNNAYYYPVKNLNVCFDGCFVFGQQELSHPHLIPGGVPSNDALVNYKDKEKKHILIVTNFIKQGFTDLNGFTFLPNDKKFFDGMDILKIQRYYNKPVVIKIKSREGGDYVDDINFIKASLPEELDYKIIVDVEDDNLLIAESEVVIGHGSTMMLKPLQLGIPTAIIKNYGYTDQG
ncbi:MAG: hypothetical protein CL662_00005, partial [Bacteroidetes bacterium]|nr:hypothetical protein [Bacteroidota bacterium]